MMDRRRFLLTSLAGALAAPLAAGAQQTGKVPRIGILSSSSLEREQGYLAAFEQGLHDLGYSEGKNLLIDRRYAAGQFDTLPDLAADLGSRKVGILVVTGTPAALCGKKGTQLIPIVSVTAGDPMGTGLITGFARPGGNVTGLTDLAAGLVTKRLELHKEVMPSPPRARGVLKPHTPITPP